MFGKIKRTVSFLLLSLLIISVLASCGANNSDIPNGYQLVACDGDEFRLYVPTQGWMPNTSGGVTGANFSMAENSSVAVYVADDGAGLTVDEYWEICHDRFGKELDKYAYVGKSEKTVLGGEPAKKYVYTAEITTVSEGVSTTQIYKFMQVLANHNGKMFVFIYSAPEVFYDSHIVDVEGDGDNLGILGYFKFAEPYSAEGKNYSDDVTPPEGMKLISTDERAYRFYVPENWTDNSRTEASAAYFSDTDRSNVSVQMYMTSNEERTVEEYFAECEARYKDLYDVYKLEKNEDVKIDGVDSKKYTYSITVGGCDYKQMQAIVKKGAVYYVITYTATADKFDLHIADVEKMIEHFDVR